MPLRIGIVGLPNVGKSTLFNALTRSRGALSANYPFCTIDPNVGAVKVPDERLDRLAELVKPEKIIPAVVEFVDIAGLVRGASKGEGLGNTFLTHIREVDALCHVMRAFESTDIIHVEGSPDPKRDREIIEAELMLADLDTLARRREKAEGAARCGDKRKRLEVQTAGKLEQELRAGILASHIPLKPEESAAARDFHLLTMKPMLYALNIAETELQKTIGEPPHSLLDVDQTAEVICISAKIEEDLQDLSSEEASAFLQELGVSSSGLDRLIRSAYRLLRYKTFFTAGPKEVRAWTITSGMTAPEAAGTIHTDFQRGFICAETIAYEDYIATGSEQKAKETGKMRQEGKEYVMEDGDVIHFRFNV